MANTVLDVMCARYRSLTASIKHLETTKEKLAEGNINIKYHNGHAYYYQHINNCHKYLNRKDTALIRQLVQKDHINKAIKAAKHEAEVLKKDIIGYPKDTMEKVYEMLPEERKKYASPLILSDEEYAKAWLATPYEPKPFSKDAPKYYTMKGERVRSKIEVIIADRLYIKGIPYKYECPVVIDGVVFHPDFTILRLSDRKVLYHEHFGKMGDAGYVEDMIDRVNKYARAQIFLGDRLFCTFESETQPIDLSWLDDFIEKNYR